MHPGVATMRHLARRVAHALRRHPATSVVAVIVAFFFIDRLVARGAILDVYAAPSERTFGNQLAGVLLGLAEDLLVALLLLAAFALLELLAAVLRALVARVPLADAYKNVCRWLGRGLRAVLVLALVLLAVAPFAADMLLMRTRGMRFTSELIATYQREHDQASSVQLEASEVRLAVETCVAVGVFVVAFTAAYVAWLGPLRVWRGDQADKSSDSFDGFAADTSSSTPSCVDLEMAASDKNKESDASFVAVHSTPSARDAGREHLADDATPTATDSTSTSEPPLSKRRRALLKLRQMRGVRVAAALVASIALFLVTHAIAKAVSPVVSAIALNAGLNELCRNVFHIDFLPGMGSGSIESAAFYLGAPATETYELFQDDVLFRKTTGFTGPLAFNVSVDAADPPNVLVVAVESFRYKDSLYLAGNTTACDQMRAHNLTLTPQFDRWAKRGLAFSNMWSRWQTSRSLEAILFGQVAYDSVTDSGTTHGRKDTKLVGMPQFFKQKGYETVFTTGSITTYDQWDLFLPSHGFETVLGAPDMKIYAEKHYNISKVDWGGPAHRSYGWGVHDDVSFDIIGDLMIDKLRAQAKRVKRGEPKQPFFLNHYTISSHHPFDSYPAWFKSEKLPDFSPLCIGWEDECRFLKNYAKMRYFTDMELGKFLDRMEKEGVLKDTIVVVVGDHGQSPEIPATFGIQSAVVHVAGMLIAEGRLGKHVGTVFEDATHHYDLLNTLADIVGVPSEGFLQTGVGRSLKRKVPFGERLVWSNNPMKRMSVVRAHERLVYDRTSNDLGLYDTLTDPLEKTDLLPTRTSEERASWFARRRAGRELNAYFKQRWDKKCLASVACE